MADKLRKYKSLYSSTCNTFSTGEGVTITPASVAGLPTDTEITLTFDRIDSSGTKTPSKMERIRGTVTGGNFVISSGGRAVEGTEQVHTSPVVEMVWNADDWNDTVDWGLVEHGQDGKHTDAIVTSLKATGAEINTGTEDAKIVTPKALADSDYAKTSDITVTPDSTTTFSNKTLTSLTNSIYGNSLYQQAIINGGFTVNQRVYVSNATLAAGAYGHDRWKAGASGGDYTFTQLPQSTQITIKTGKSLIQVIEDKNVIGGHYTLSWEGTAQARFGIDSATPSGAYAASPVTITTQTAGTVMSVEFNEGTLGKVVLNSGEVALPFMPKSYEDELRACQRYCPAFIGANDFQVIGFAYSTTGSQITLKLPVTARTAPAGVIVSNLSHFSLYNSTFSSGNPTAIAINASGKNMMSLNITTTAGSPTIAKNEPVKLQIANAAGYLIFDGCEL